MEKDQVLQKLFDMVDEATDELVELQQEPWVMMTIGVMLE